MEGDDIYKRILVSRARTSQKTWKPASAMFLVLKPMFDILNVSIHMGIYETCMRMITAGCFYSKGEWKQIVHVWEKARLKEDDECVILYKQPHQNNLLFKVTGKPYYLVWWILADLFHKKIRMCEEMATLACETGLLKKTIDYRLKRMTFSNKVSTNCDLSI